MAFIGYLTLVPAFFIHFLYKKRTSEWLQLLFGGAIGFIIAGYAPISFMQHYMSIHNYLFSTFKINIYFLDYAGFGIMVAALSMATCGLLLALLSSGMRSLVEAILNKK